MTPSIGPFFLCRPSYTDRRALEKRIPTLPFNFPHVGITKGSLSIETTNTFDGYSVDRTRVQIGSGKEAYDAAIDALFSWDHFNFNWAFTNEPPIALNSPVVVVAKSLFLWSMNPLKITWVGKNGQPPRPKKENIKKSCGFAHTTLAGHQISGEECFTIEWNRKDDSVQYEVLTVSKPATAIAVLARPLLRYYQRKFVEQSIKIMKDQVAFSSKDKKKKKKKKKV